MVLFLVFVCDRLRKHLYTFLNQRKWNWSKFKAYDLVNMLHNLKYHDTHWLCNNSFLSLFRFQALYLCIVCITPCRKSTHFVCSFIMIVYENFNQNFLSKARLIFFLWTTITKIIYPPVSALPTGCIIPFDFMRTTGILWRHLFCSIRSIFGGGLFNCHYSLLSVLSQPVFKIHKTSWK